MGSLRVLGAVFGPLAYAGGHEFGAVSISSVATVAAEYAIAFPLLVATAETETAALKDEPDIYIRVS